MGEIPRADHAGGAVIARTRDRRYIIFGDRRPFALPKQWGDSLLVADAGECIPLVDASSGSSGGVVFGGK